MSVTRTCICCGEKYQYCPSCGREENPTWKRIYDNKECKEIAYILMSSNGEGGISKEEARKKMEKYPDTLQKIFDYDSLTANAIKEIFGIATDREREKTLTTYVSNSETGELEKVEPVKEELEIVQDVVEDEPELDAVKAEAETVDEVAESQEESVDNKEDVKKSENKNSGNKRKRYYKK